MGEIIPLYFGEKNKHYLEELRQWTKARNTKLNTLIIEIISDYMDTHRAYVESKLTDYRMGQVKERRYESPNVFCKECGASEVDSEGYVIHGVDCSETQRLVVQWGSREAWKQWVRSQKKDGILR